jgi:hypothetical protein
MKLVLIALMSLTSVFAQTADVTCSINQPITIEGTFGNVSFRQAELDFSGVDKEDAFSTFLTIQDRFGSAYETFGRLYNETFRCSFGNICLSTDFSNIRGMSFSFPPEVFSANFYNFTMRVRSNRNNRSYFARCDSRLR